MAKDFFKTEDYWAICIGFFCLFLGLVLFFIDPPTNIKNQSLIVAQLSEEQSKKPYKTIKWYELSDAKQKIKGSNQPKGKFLKKLTGKPTSWENNPWKGFVFTQAQVTQQQTALKERLATSQSEETQLKEVAKRKSHSAELANYQNEKLNKEASDAIQQWRLAKKKRSSLQKKYNAKAKNQWPYLVGLFLFLGILFGIGGYYMGVSGYSFLKGFAFVFLISLIAYTLAGQINMKAIGFGYAAWAIILGLLISNTVGTPNWVKPALRTELYIKTGLVILGAEILLSKILAIGLPGIFVAWVVTPIVLVTTYWLGQKVIKIPSKTLNMTISADMSVCGVSAAVATAAACKASEEELTLAIGLSMIFTSIMMIVEPAFINWIGMPEVLGGAWIGGTIDATGAVVAAGAFLGDKALNVAATIKMIQNILIGVIAFGVAIYFAAKVDKTNDKQIGWSEIWKRFPKFILGFIAASILFSGIYAFLGEGKAYTLIDQGVIGGFTKNIRGWLFCLAFTSIGLSIHFKELRKHFTEGKPLLLYVVGQSLNLCLTLLMAYLMFYKVFPHITANI